MEKAEVLNGSPPLHQSGMLSWAESLSLPAGIGLPELELCLPLRGQRWFFTRLPI